LPYQGTDGWAIGLQHINAPIPRLPPELAHLQPLLDSLLAKEPAARPQTGAELLQRIDSLLTGPVTMPMTSMASGGNASLPSSRDRWLGVAGVLALVIAGGAIYLKGRPAHPPPAAPAEPVAAVPHSSAAIAVMPFVDLSQGKNEEYFADGLAEEVLNRLAEIPQLRVAGRTSSFSFKGKDEDLRSVGRKLDVSSILEGSVRSAGDRVRISVQLVNATDGVQLWSETYDRQLTDILAVQDDIASAVVAAMKVKLLPQQSAPRTHRAVNPAAYTQYLLAWHDKNFGTPETAAATVQAFRKAIELDPGFADAYAMLAMAEFWASDYAADATELAAGQQRALAAAETAIKLDPALAEGYWARGNIRSARSWDWNGAQQDFRHALDLNPGRAQFLQAYASLQASLGQLPEAIALAREAAEREPLTPAPWQALGYFLDASGSYAEARQAQQRALVLKPKFPFAHFRLGVVSLLEGHPEQAGAEFEASGYEPLQLEGRAMTEHSLRHAKASDVALAKLTADYGFNAAYQIAQTHAWRGERDAAFAWLDKAYEQRDGGLVEVKYDPLLRSLRSDPRYLVLLKKMNLPG
jgi:TolB-like protein/Flp pilus assembly protein TadD